MSTRSYTLFISDLHLQESTPKITDTFLSFLEEHQNSAESLYILGDFFEAWIGDDDHSPYNLRIIRALQTAARQGLNIYFMVGNRDFLLSSGFAREAQLNLIPDPYIIELYGTRLLLTHGDALCTLDTSYQKLRLVTHNSFVQALALMLPLPVRRYIGNRMRAHSRGRHPTVDHNLSDVPAEEAIKLMEKYEVQHMIHGHTHRPKIHEHRLSDGSTAKRIVLDAWFTQGNALFWDENGKIELKHFPFKLA